MLKMHLRVVADDYALTQQLPVNMEVTQSLANYDLSKAQLLAYFEFDDAKFGEFSHGEQHYHFYILNDGRYLVYNVTKISVVNRALKDIILILISFFIVVVLISVWLAKFGARFMLLPFHRLTQIFAQRESAIPSLKRQLETITEQDVKGIAEQLVNALEAHAFVNEQQIAFNQGMSHELRTPLQVMTHSIELLLHQYPELAGTPSFNRLQAAVNRMKRLANGLLWLTSAEPVSEPFNAEHEIEKMHSELTALLVVQQAELDINLQGQLYLKMPSIVFELIVFNLLGNFLQHNKMHRHAKTWQITIFDSSIEFKNKCDESDELQKGFGLGLKLVEKLASRFDLRVTTQHANDMFSVILSTDLPR